MSDWRDSAACRGGDPERWFPINEAGTNPSDEQLIADAKAICRACPSQGPCLAWAVANHCTYGVWGGLTSGERAALTRQASPAQPADTVLINRARLGYPVRVDHNDRRRIVAALPDVSEVRLARVFGVSGKTIYNDRVVLTGERPESWSWRRQEAVR